MGAIYFLSNDNKMILKTNWSIFLLYANIDHHGPFRVTISMALFPVTTIMALLL